ncbi:RNA-directed DNA polymerase (Reverse transcriptase), partial [Trifolium medium]|nr:RNA-directed DNA polymerase (Reverse transcriptase) [Trifolium medium]
NNLVQECIPDLVSDEDNAALVCLSSPAEIKSAVFEMNGDGAQGPDGYSGHFFQTYWDIIHHDVVASIQSFFLTGKFIPNFNSSLIILIPKTSGADTIAQFRPIALANFQFKIITKILADRLSLIASRIISTHQRGFIPGRHISDCVIVTSEADNVLSRKSFAGNIALKIDIQKAFDTIDWLFLLDVLHKFGFGNTFCDWISEILHSARLSVLVNGKSVGYFNCDRGVRQGDPLSPLLFCIAEEVLSRCISKAMMTGALQPMTLCQGIQVPSHVLYADDIMIFCKASKKNIKQLLLIFKLYGQASGQLVNKQKSKFYAGAIPNARMLMLSNLLSFTSSSLPFTYLGLPLVNLLAETNGEMDPQLYLERGC